MSDDLDQLKSDPSVLRVYANYVHLQKRGDKYVGCCPVHHEKTPSFTVFSDFRFQCFGCGKAGNIFQLVQEMDGVGFKQAVEKVRQAVGDSDWSSAKQKVDQVFKPVAEPKTYKTIPLDQWQKLEDNLTRSKAALDWLLNERGIGPGTAQRLRLGFTQSIGNLASKEGADVADKGWLAFPCIEGDKVVSIKYRSIAAKRFSRQPGMATALFNTESVDIFEPVYVVEGEIDCLTLEQAGFRAVSLPSASTKLTPEQKDQIMRAPTVFLAGDNDAAGTGATDRLWKELGNNVYKLTWPEGMKDANQTWLEYSKRDPQHFQTTVEGLTRKAKSQPVPDIYSIQEILENGQDTSLSDRPDRLRFPWAEVDRAAVLLPGSVLGVLATSTSMGKTAFALQYSLFGARNFNEIVINWQCELSPAELSVMVAAQILHKNRNFLAKEDLKEAANRLEGVQYYVGNNPSINRIEDVLDIMEAAIRRTGATIAVLDNAHFYTSGVDDDVKVLAAALKRIKQIAVGYGVKFTVVFQPRKASQANRNKKTQISDVKGSATAGDTCDAVVALHRNLVKSADGEEKPDIYEEKTLVEWIKTRSKGVGKASTHLHFFGEFAEFAVLDTVHEEAA